jgi:C-terminal processing protease CtpA/Prc
MGNSVSLVDSVKTGGYSYASIEQILKQNPSHVHTADTDGQTALHHACSAGRTDLVKLFITYGANVNQLDSQLNTPLHHAVFTNHQDAAQVLIEAGALLNSINVDCMSPLHYAVQQKAYKSVELLIEKGADGNLRNTKGDTPQDMALHLKQPHKTQMHQLLNNSFAKRLKTGEIQNEKRVHRLVGLCRVWGAVKYIHPFLAYKHVDWDQTLLDVIYRVNEAQSTADFKNGINQLLLALGDKNTRCVEVQELQQQHHLLHHHFHTAPAGDKSSTPAATSSTPAPAATTPTPTTPVTPQKSSDPATPAPSASSTATPATPAKDAAPADAAKDTPKDTPQSPAKADAAPSTAPSSTPASPDSPAPDTQTPSSTASPSATDAPAPAAPSSSEPEPSVAPEATTPGPSSPPTKSGLYFVSLPINDEVSTPDDAAGDSTAAPASVKAAVIVGSNYSDFSQPGNGFVPTFAEARKEQAQIIVFDVRRRGGDGPAYWMAHNFLTAFRMFFLRAPLVLPTVRQRVWSRSEHGNVGGWGLFQGAFLTFDAPVLYPEVPLKEYVAYAGVPVMEEEPERSPVTPQKQPQTPVKTPSSSSIQTPVKSPATGSASPTTPAKTPLKSSSTAIPASPAPVSAPAAAADTQVEPFKFVFIVNEGTPGRLVELATGLRSKQLATIVYEKTPITPSPTASPLEVVVSNDSAFELGVSNLVFGLPENLVVFLRKTEFVNPDGSLGFYPDVVVTGGQPATDPHQDELIKLAIDIGTGNKQLPPPPARASAAAYHVQPPSKPVVWPSLRNKGAPAVEFRLLALFKLWNDIQYFYGYKSSLEAPWESVLPEYILRLERVQDAQAYGQLFAELVARLNDTHAYVNSAALQSYYGTHVPPITVRFVQDATIVTSIHSLPEGTQYLPSPDTGSTHSASTPLAVGDYVLSVDNESVVERRKRLSKFISGSTPQSLHLKLHRILLAGPEKSKCKLEVRTRDGRITALEVPRVAPLPASWGNGGSDAEENQRQKKLPAFVDFHNGISYLDMTRTLSPAELEAAFQNVKDGAVRVLIIDLRGECSVSTRHLLAKVGKAREIVGARTRAPFLFPTVMYSDLESSHIEDRQIVQPPPTAWKFEGKIIALISEDTIRNAELACLYLENSGTPVTFVGSPSSGTNGDPTSLTLPGGLVVGFTGVGVVKGDGQPVQGKGIQPHIAVSTTIEGVRFGRDEIFERAFQYAAENLLNQ